MKYSDIEDAFMFVSMSPPHEHYAYLKPFEKFAAMIERHWDDIAAFCKSENKVSLGFVEGLNNKIWVIQC